MPKQQYIMPTLHSSWRTTGNPPFSPSSIQGFASCQPASLLLPVFFMPRLCDETQVFVLTPFNRPCLLFVCSSGLPLASFPWIPPVSGLLRGFPTTQSEAMPVCISSFPYPLHGQASLSLAQDTIAFRGPCIVWKHPCDLPLRVSQNPFCYTRVHLPSWAGSRNHTSLPRSGRWSCLAAAFWGQERRES